MKYTDYSKNLQETEVKSNETNAQRNRHTLIKNIPTPISNSEIKK